MDFTCVQLMTSDDRCYSTGVVFGDGSIKMTAPRPAFFQDFGTWRSKMEQQYGDTLKIYSGRPSPPSSPRKLSAQMLRAHADYLDMLDRLD
jgi:hypothetical protein